MNIILEKPTCTIFRLPCFYLHFKSFYAISRASIFHLSGKIFEILGPRNEIHSKPWYTVLIGVIKNWELFMSSQCCLFLCLKSSVTIKGDKPFFILYISVARIWRFRWWTETEPSFSNNVSNDDCLSEYIIHKQCSCNLFILPLLARLWHIHTRRTHT